MPLRQQALRQLVDVVFHAAKIGVEKVRHHQDAVPPLGKRRGAVRAVHHGVLCAAAACCCVRRAGCAVLARLCAAMELVAVYCLA